MILYAPAHAPLTTASATTSGGASTTTRISHVAAAVSSNTASARTGGSRSSTRPSRMPMNTVGANSATYSSDDHVVECVWS